jgi:hypothetical protein
MRNGRNAAGGSFHFLTIQMAIAGWNIRLRGDKDHEAEQTGMADTLLLMTMINKTTEHI